ADQVIYQSNFVKEWWHHSGWRKRQNEVIIYNGVQVPFDLRMNGFDNQEVKRLVILEGTLDYTPYAVQLINELAINLSSDIDIEVYGRFEHPSNQENLHNRIIYN